MQLTRQEEQKRHIFQPYAHLDKTRDMALAKLSIIKVYSEGACSSLRCVGSKEVRHPGACRAESLENGVRTAATSSCGHTALMLGKSVTAEED